MSSSLSGVQLHYERQAPEPCVQCHHVGVSLPRSGCPGVSLLPGVVRSDTLPSERGMYFTYMCTASTGKALKSKVIIRRTVWLPLYLDDAYSTLKINYFFADSAQAISQAIKRLGKTDITIIYSDKNMLSLRVYYTSVSLATSVTIKINKTWQKVQFVPAKDMETYLTIMWDLLWCLKAWTTIPLDCVLSSARRKTSKTYALNKHSCKHLFVHMDAI